VKKVALLACAAALLSAGPVLAKVKEPTKVTGAGALKGVRKVVIGQVTIGFLVERRDSTKAGGGLTGSGFGGRSTTRSTLVGVTIPELQAIAGEAYVDLEKQLKAAGYEVIDRAAFAQHPPLVKTSGLPIPHAMTVTTGRDDQAKVLFVSAPQTAPLRMFTGDAFVSGFAAMGQIMAGSQVVGAATDFAKAQGTHVVNIVYYVDFADADEYGGWFRNSSAVSVKASLALLPDQSKLSVIGPGYKSGAVQLADPVAVGGDFFDAADATTGGQKAEQAIANVIGLFGGVGTNSSKRLTFTARPGTYVPGATQAVVDANAVLVGKLATMR
jgi:hypothetical protein